MPWVRIDDQFPDHPKVIAAGPLAKGLYLDALCYANRLLTDGFIPKRIAARLAAEYADYAEPSEVIDRLVTEGLWERRDDGFQVHDFLEYQPSAEKVKAERDANAKRQAEWRARHRNLHGQFDSNAVSHTVTNGVTTPVTVTPNNGGSNAKVTPAPIPSQPIPKEKNDAPLPPAENGAAPAPPVNAPHRLFSLFCELTSVDQSDVPKATKEKQHGIFKHLLDKHAAADVEGCMRWLTTWRTVPWKPESLWEHIDTWILENRPTNGKRPPPRPAKPTPLRVPSSDVVTRSDGDKQRQIIGR